MVTGVLENKIQPLYFTKEETEAAEGKGPAGSHGDCGDRPRPLAFGSFSGFSFTFHPPETHTQGVMSFQQQLQPGGVGRWELTEGGGFRLQAKELPSLPQQSESSGAFAPSRVQAPPQTCRARSSRGRCLLWILWRGRLCRPESWAPVKIEPYSRRRSGAGYLALENTCGHRSSGHSCWGLRSSSQPGFGVEGLWAGGNLRGS